jgi:hypothetical protein
MKINWSDGRRVDLKDPEWIRVLKLDDAFTIVTEDDDLSAWDDMFPKQED